MDTIENNGASAGSDDVTSSPGTATQVDTQTVETSGTFDGGNDAETGKLFAGKYKSAEELEKAYKESEAKIGSLGQKAKVADILQEKYGITPEQLQSQIDRLEAQQRQERYANDPTAPLYDKVTELESKIAQQEQEKALAQTKQELDSFLRENPAFESHKDKIMKLALTPGIGFDPQTGQEVGFDEIAREYFGEARAQGQQDAYRKIETKQMTQPTGTSSVSKRSLTQEEFAKLSVAEMEALLPHADISHRL